MLSVQEALLLKAAQEEVEAEQAVQLGGVAGGAMGAVAGRLSGAIPHQMGRGLNAITGRKPAMMKPGFRMAGGLTGAILGGSLGAGTAALMKQDNPSANLLAKIQSSGELTPADERQLEDILTQIYSNQGG